MLDGRRQEDWQHTCQLMVTMANSFRSGGNPVKFADIYPYSEKSKPSESPEDLESARALWLKVAGQRS